MAGKTKSYAFQADASATELSRVVGPMDRNLRQVEATLGVRIARRDRTFSIVGDPQASARAVSVLDELVRLSQQGRGDIGDRDVQILLSGRRAVEEPAAANFAPLKVKREVQPRTPRQRQYLEAMAREDVVFGIGPAGTGKTYLAVAMAVDAFERGQVERIVLTRPAVEAGERLGFLPGDLTQKVDPYLRPLYDALYDLLGFDKTQRLLERQAIEVAPLAYMRGRTLNASFIILDEAQNTTPEQMKMFLTRIGFGSKAVVTGDVTQMDLPKGQKSGLVDAGEVLDGVKGVSVTRFKADDVVRHPLVARIVEAYERAQAPSGQGAHR